MDVGFGNVLENPVRGGGRGRWALGQYLLQAVVAVSST